MQNPENFFMPSFDKVADEFEKIVILLLFQLELFRNGLELIILFVIVHHRTF